MKNILSPDREYKYITAAIMVFAAVVLALAAAGALKLDADELRRRLPAPGDLATSPIALDLLKQKERSGNETADSARVPAPAGQAIADLKENPATPKTAAELVSEPEKTVAVVPQDPSTAAEAPRSDMIMISKIGVTAPVITPQTRDSGRLKEFLDSGAVIYPDSAIFGAAGQTIVLGHSAPPGWPEIKHDTIFSRIAELAAGDKIVVVYNDRTYNYSVLQSQIVERGGDIPAIAQAGSSLVLVTCWPPGRNLKRLIVEAALDFAE